MQELPDVVGLLRFHGKRLFPRVGNFDSVSVDQADNSLRMGLTFYKSYPKQKIGE